MHRFKLLALVVVMPLFGCFGMNSSTTFAVRSGDVAIPVPEFTLTERSGKTVSRDDLKGKVWVAAFVFVRCPGPCPQVTATMARLQKELDLQNNDNVRLVTFTVDPERDNARELTDYAKRYQADPERWLFLTGKSEAELHALLKDGFKVTAQRAKNPKDEFDHSSRLAVVDKHGNIRGYFDGIRPVRGENPDAEFDANLKKLKELVAELQQQ